MDWPAPGECSKCSIVTLWLPTTAKRLRYPFSRALGGCECVYRSPAARLSNATHRCRTESLWRTTPEDCSRPLALTGAPILVLDEPTSALDSHHEQVIQQSLRSLKGKRTIVLVSHRIGTVMDCDLIYVLDGGKIVEQGTHSELIRLGGIYASMAKEQLWLNSPRVPEAT